MTKESDMKILGLIIMPFIIGMCDTSDRKLSEDRNYACIIRFLQIKGKLSENFLKVTAPSDICRILLPLVYANQSEKLGMKIYESKNSKAACVFEKLKDSEFIDLELTHEVFLASNMTNKNAMRKKLWEIMRDQRLILERISYECQSDSTFNGVFDEILGINSSLAVLEQNYCLVLYSVENGFLHIPKSSINGTNVTKAEALDCLRAIRKVRSEKQKALHEAFKRRKYSAEAITCLLDKYHDERIFGWNLAKDVVNKININIDDKLRRSEDLRLSKILADFSRISTNCLYSFNWELFQ
jgi:hypothetical protein